MNSSKIHLTLHNNLKAYGYTTNYTLVHFGIYETLSLPKKVARVA